MFLSLVTAPEKYAEELDPSARRILRDELGVELIHLEDYERYFDAIVMSHVLEHFKFNEVEHQLRVAYKALRNEGLLLVDVPQGASQLTHFDAGTRPVQRRMEPHTIFFSSVALNKILEEVGFQLRMATICAWTRSTFPQYEERLRESGVEVPRYGHIVSLASKME